MSSAQPGSNSGEGGRKGQGRSSKKDKKTGIGSINTAKMERGQHQSQQAKNVLKVIRNGVHRLMTERIELGEVIKDLRLTEEDLDKEIARVTRMTNISQRAQDFQHGNLSEDVLVTLNTSIDSPATEGEPTPGPSSSTGSAGASAETSAFRAITDNFLFDVGSGGLDASSDADLGGVGYFNKLMEGMGIWVDTFPEGLVEEVAQNFKRENGDEKVKDDEA